MSKTCVIPRCHGTSLSVLTRAASFSSYHELFADLLGFIFSTMWLFIFDFSLTVFPFLTSALPVLDQKREYAVQESTVRLNVKIKRLYCPFFVS